MKQPELMADNSVPEPVEGVVENIMTRAEMRKTRVKVNFIPRKAKYAPVRPRRFEFATVVMANEFIAQIKPPIGQQLGSPKQREAKIARLLGLGNLSIMKHYDIETELEINANAPAGDSSGNVDPTELDTFREGMVELDEPTDDEAILNEDDDTEGFPGL